MINLLVQENQYNFQCISGDLFQEVEVWKTIFCVSKMIQLKFSYGVIYPFWLFILFYAHSLIAMKIFLSLLHHFLSMLQQLITLYAHLLTWTTHFAIPSSTTMHFIQTIVQHRFYFILFLNAKCCNFVHLWKLVILLSICNIIVFTIQHHHFYDTTSLSIELNRSAWSICLSRRANMVSSMLMVICSKK